MFLRFYSNRFPLHDNQTTANELTKTILSTVSTGIESYHVERARVTKGVFVGCHVMHLLPGLTSYYPQ